MTDLERNGNGHQKIGIAMDERARSSPSTGGGGPPIALIGIFSFLAMVMSIAALATIAAKDVDSTCNLDDIGIKAAINASQEHVTGVVSNSCTAAVDESGSSGMRASGLEMVAHAYNNMGDNPAKPFPNAERRYEGMASQLKTIGTIQELLAEASDAGSRKELIEDGKSGDVDFPHGDFQPILTYGEYDAKSGYMPVGVPDGQGVYLKDMDTVRLVVQAESYGHIAQNPSWYLPVNDGAAHFTGSHISYVDYDKSTFKAAVAVKGAIAPTVKGAGELFHTAYNLAGNMVDSTTANPHYGDTGANGLFVSNSYRSTANEWTYHSFCSAHLEEAHQWGPGIGVEDDMFVTVEEWTSLDSDAVAVNGFVGLSAHTVDMATNIIYATGAFGMGGYEKIVEISCGVPNYACFSLSGYNGNFGDAKTALITRKQNVQAKRADGTDWAYPQNIVPSRVYIGAKGYEANGVACGGDGQAVCSFLAKNGMAFGRVYGFAVPTATPDRDAWHKGNDRAQTPDKVDGVFAPTNWQWDGTVKDFEHDQAWDFQEPPVMPSGADFKFWTAKGRDAGGSKTEHNSPDPRGAARFVQGSTAGYMGIYDLSAGSSADARSLTSILSAMGEGQFPEFIPAAYELLEGETAINSRIELGGKGIRADGNDQTMMRDSSADKATFEDIDGLEWFAAADGRDFLVIQEDGGNQYGERVFLSEIPAKGVLPKYYFLAQAGGAKNTRMLAGVGIPAGTNNRATGMEFSGVSDLSGAFIQTTLGGQARRQAEATVAINDKFFSMGLQGHPIGGGVVKAFGVDRGGQVYAYKPQNIA